MLMVFTMSLAHVLGLLFIKQYMLIIFVMNLTHLLVLFSIKSRRRPKAVRVVQRDPTGTPGRPKGSQSAANGSPDPRRGASGAANSTSWHHFRGTRGTRRRVHKSYMLLCFTMICTIALPIFGKKLYADGFYHEFCTCARPTFLQKAICWWFYNEFSTFARPIFDLM